VTPSAVLPAERVAGMNRGQRADTLKTGIGAGAATQSRQPRCLPPPLSTQSTTWGMN
jgi:hypothetical protein